VFSLNLGTLAIHLKVLGGPFFQALDRAQRALQFTAERFTAIGRKMTYAVTLPLVGLGGLAVKLASDAEEIDSKFRVIFSGVEKSAVDAMNELDKAYGVNATEAKEMLGATGNVLTGFGFTQKAALDLSMEVQKLSVDLASLQNLEGGAKRASNSLTKAMLGERESLKLLGVVIREEDVEARVLTNTQKGLAYATKNQAKAYAVLQIAQEQAKNAIGDYARTSSSFANQWREMISDMKAAGEEWGKILLPHAKKFIAYVKEMFAWFQALHPEMKQTVVNTLALVAVLGPLAWAIGSIAVVLKTTLAIFTTLGVGGLLTLGLLLGAVVLLVDAFDLLDTSTGLTFGNIRMGSMNIRSWMETAATYIYQAWDYLVNALVIAWEWWIDKALRGIEILYQTMLRVAHVIASVFWRFAQEIVSSFLWMVRKMIEIAEALGAIDENVASLMRLGLKGMDRDLKQYAQTIDDFYYGALNTTLDKAEKRQTDYYANMARLRDKWSEIGESAEADRLGIAFLDALNSGSKAVEAGKQIADVVSDDVKQAGGGHLSKAEFKETSLRRFSLSSPIAAKAQKQEVRDDVVAGKLDDIYQLMNTRKGLPALLG